LQITSTFKPPPMITVCSCERRTYLNGWTTKTHWLHCNFELLSAELIMLFSPKLNWFFKKN
jgi:hypothetical protein